MESPGTTAGLEGVGSQRLGPVGLAGKTKK